VLAPLGAVLLAVESSPRVTGTGTPDAAAAARVRELAARFQVLVENDSAAGVFTVSEADMNAALASVSRVLPGVAGRVAVRDGQMEAGFSAGAPYLPEGRWINLQATVAASEDGLAVTRLQVGRLPLPPGPTLWALRVGLDGALGDGIGTAVLRWIAALQIDPPNITLVLEPGELTGAGRVERLKARLRAMAAGTTEPGRVRAHLRALHSAAEDGKLAGEDGSLLPYLAYTVAQAGAHEAADPRSEMRAAIFALALYCGDPRFGGAIGVWLPGSMQGARNHCAEATLAGRQDIVRHFVLSAGIHAASTDRTVLGLGELKELLDSNPGGTGFSFDDMAANLAGARYAALLMEAPPAVWPDLAAAITTEADVMPPIDGLPEGLDAEAFQAAYGDIDSPAYRELMAEIEDRIDALPLPRRVPAD
jgi:hypothetical protein